VAPKSSNQDFQADFGESLSARLENASSGEVSSSDFEHFS
jgi:hypothetical protein